jgi:HEAT repeat protein
VLTENTEHVVTLRQSLQSDDHAIRFNAGLDLVKLGDVAGVPALIEAFAHESAVVRLFQAAKAQIQFGEPADETSGGAGRSAAAR